MVAGGPRPTRGARRLRVAPAHAASRRWRHDRPHLLPYLRRGLVACRGRRYRLGRPRRRRGAARLTVAGKPVDADVGLLAPQHVASIAPGEIVRRYPVPGAVDVETNYFPLIEFAAPDLPWRYTPAGPGTHGRLRPWLALVVVEAAPRASTTRGRPARRAARRAGPAAPAARRPRAVGLGARPVVAPRRRGRRRPSRTSPPRCARGSSARGCMEPGRHVPGRARERVRGRAPTSASEPAWGDAAPGRSTLVVYDTWTFTTAAEAGDFESLCELLLPADEVGELGVREVDVTAPGLEVAWPKTPRVVELVGALADPG